MARPFSCRSGPRPDRLQPARTQAKGPNAAGKRSCGPPFSSDRRPNGKANPARHAQNARLPHRLRLWPNRGPWPHLRLGRNWQPLDAPAITLALTARTLAYKDGATQRFNEDASTIYTTTHPSTGAWRVERNQYCSQWPPSDRWSCYDVARSADGLDLRFTAGDGSGSVGRYIDLK